MKSGIITPFVFAVILFSFIQYSCKQSSTVSGENDSTIISIDSSLSEATIAVYPLPAPFELYQQLKNLDASCVDEILNPPENIDNYYTEKNKVLNLGTYAADLCYVSTYQKKQEMQLYSGNVKSLMDDLDITIGFTDFNSDEIKHKLDNEDTLVNIVSGMFYDAYTALVKDGDPALAALMLAGIWSEGVYIASHISSDTYTVDEVIEVLNNQRSSLEMVLDMLIKTKGNEITNSLIKALFNVKAIYEETEGSLTKEQLHQVTRAIENIRSSIIS
jgi:hypothetical protein